ncbi:anaerobic ribonucleoside-triphosphate reductase [Vibrio breoganii]
MKALMVVKRDGTRRPYDIGCISRAIEKAFIETGEVGLKYYLVVARLVAEGVEVKLAEAAVTATGELHIAHIQSFVESELMSKFPLTGKAYVEFRAKRDKARQKDTALYKGIMGLIEQTNVDVLNENANKDGKLSSTVRDLMAGVVAKEISKNHLLSGSVVEAHESGDIHFHDLDYSPFHRGMFNCMLIDVSGMLKNGCRVGTADIETPKSIATAAAVTAQIMIQVSSSIFGGATVHAIDSVLAPYVKMSWDKHYRIGLEESVVDPVGYADRRTEKECYDAFQTLEYTIQTVNSCQGQTPFTTLGLSGFDVSKEARMITRSILQVRIAGLGAEKRTAIFPKLVYTLRDGYNLNPEDPNYDLKQLALECSTKRMYPDIMNYEKVVEVTGSYKTPMGCRSFLSQYVDDNGDEIHEGRNNLGVVSLNLPRLALESADLKDFYKRLNDRLIICKSALGERLKSFEGVTASCAPILYMHGACGVRLNADDEIMGLFKDGRASISLGYIGVHEAVTHLCNLADLDFNEYGSGIGLAIMKVLKGAVDEWKSESGFGYSLYGTPSENLCYRFAKLDQAKFGTVDGITDRDYYTNSFHVDVRREVNAFDKIDYEAPFVAYSSGGFICYAEFPSLKNNVEALENFWDYCYARVPYIGANQPIDECFECGYGGEFDCSSKGFVCPNCGNHDPQKCQVTRRVCGYLGSPDARPFNAGKQQEVSLRKKHA